MGKRSSFKRNPRDFYPTPAAAVAPLARHLPPAFTFIEPAAGNGQLVRQLETMGGTCVFAADIEPQAPGILEGCILDQPLFWPASDLVVTNPPWDRSLLHGIIDLVDRPTWLLFDADWVHTKQAVPYVHHLHIIQSVGRVR